MADPPREKQVLLPLNMADVELSSVKADLEDEAAVDLSKTVIKLPKREDEDEEELRRRRPDTTTPGNLQCE